MSLKVEKFLIDGVDYSLKGYTYVGKSGIIFQKKQPPAGYIYTQAGLDKENSGIIDCGYMINKSLQIVGNISGVATVNLLIQGKAHHLMPWSVNLPKNYTGAGGFNDWIYITERCNYIRVGLKYTGGAPNANDWVWIAFNFSS